MAGTTEQATYDTCSGAEAVVRNRQREVGISGGASQAHSLPFVSTHPYPILIPCLFNSSQEPYKVPLLEGGLTYHIRSVTIHPTAPPLALANNPPSPALPPHRSVATAAAAEAMPTAMLPPASSSKVPAPVSAEVQLEREQLPGFDQTDPPSPGAQCWLGVCSIIQ
jgi:hypothetical protein